MSYIITFLVGAILGASTLSVIMGLMPSYADAVFLGVAAVSVVIFFIINFFQDSLYIVAILIIVSILCTIGAPVAVWLGVPIIKTLVIVGISELGAAIFALTLGRTT